MDLEKYSESFNKVNLNNNTNSTRNDANSVLHNQSIDIDKNAFNKNTLKNATNFHPLMSPISQDFPDLIPKQAQIHNYDEHIHPEAHSSFSEGIKLRDKNMDVDMDISVEYDETLSGKEQS